MSRSIPAHKQTDKAKQPGQMSFDRMPYLKHSTAEPQQETTLNDYIAKKQDEPKRITFDEWWKTADGIYQWGFEVEQKTAEMIWNAALKQGKL